MYKLTQIDFIIFYHTTIYSTVWFQEVYGYYPVVLSAQGQSDPRTDVRANTVIQNLDQAWTTSSFWILPF